MGGLYFIIFRLLTVGGGGEAYVVTLMFRTYLIGHQI
jgi:hypothetical protein